MNDFQNNFLDYVCSGHAMVAVSTYEKDRAIQQIRKAAYTIKRPTYTWSIAAGWLDGEGQSVGSEGPTAPDIAIQDLQEFAKEGDCICVFKDFGFYLEHQTYNASDVVISWLEEIKQFAMNAGVTLVFIGPGFKIPTVLRHDITAIEFDLPDKEQIECHIKFACEGVTRADGTQFEPNLDMLPEMIDACKGMTQQQTIDRVALALRKHKDFGDEAVKTIMHEKAAVIRSSGLLNYIEPPEGGLDNVGGYNALKQHVAIDQPCFSDEAREFGIEFPKGILLCGTPGCGKTLLSLAIASEFKLPLISLDVGNMMSKFVGESESNMREAIKIIERVAPCVLQLDEIEKGFGGNGDLDGGSSKRVFGTFLKWLNDRTSSVYVIATANAVQSLPPEFGRKGRFDEIFGLDLPSYEERVQIFSIHLAKRGRSPIQFCLDDYAKATDGFTGADIEQAVKFALKIAFSTNEPLGLAIMLQAISGIIPLSKTEPDRIQAIRKWCGLHAKLANPQEKVNQKPKRRVTVN